MMVGLAALAAAVPARAANNVATVQANVVKPLILTWLQNLDLGTIALGPGTWSNATVGISKAGVFSCTNPNLICTGAPQAARYNVSGTNNRTVLITGSERHACKPGRPNEDADHGRGQPGLSLAHQFRPARNELLTWRLDQPELHHG
jgi:hypothetical protein